MGGKKKRKREEREEIRKREEKGEFTYGVGEEEGEGAHTNVPKSYKTDESVFYDSIYMKHPKLANLEKQKADGWFPGVRVTGYQG